MISLDARQQRLVLDLILRRVDTDVFCLRFPVKPDELPALGLRVLAAAVETRDATAVELGLHLGHRFGISRPYLDVLVRLLAADWHERHEDVALGLEKLQASETVTALHRAAVAEYRYATHDNARSIRRECARALGKIGDVAAVAVLADLLHWEKGELFAAAREQLSRVETAGADDRARKAANAAIADSERRRPIGRGR